MKSWKHGFNKPKGLKLTLPKESPIKNHQHLYEIPLDKKPKEKKI